MKISKDKWEYVCKAMGNNGVLVDKNALIATDGHRIHSVPAKGDFEPFVITESTANRILGKQFVIRSQSLITIGNWRRDDIFLIPNDLKYPPVYHFLDATDYKNHMEVDADQLHSSLKSVLPKGEDTGVIMRIYTNRKYTIFGDEISGSRGTAHSVDLKELFFDISFDAQYLIDAVIPGSVMHLHFNDAESVFRVTYNKGTGPCAVIAPRRVK
jgi:DNA polymerase III sliding clamp (beta) subunit (PCNA family)